MKNAFIAVLIAALTLPSAASAATVTADVERRQGTSVGPVTFKAASGETNEVIVTAGNGQLRFRDLLNGVTARGDCVQVNSQTARCPFTENIAKVKLGNRGDTATVEGLVRVLGGSGSDVLGGSAGNDMLDGQGGGDVLRGHGDSDDLTGGRGEDALFGGGGDDDLIDGETDGQAATDLYRGGSHRDFGGPDRGDMILYTKRNAALTIDLSRKQVNAGPEGDDVIGLESVAAGAGNDRLTGDGGENWLDGNGGDDALRGGGDADSITGGVGEDDVSGGGDNDVVSGQAGTDTIAGDNGDDLLISSDANEETLGCGDGEDTARATRRDTLGECEFATAGPFRLQVQPTIDGNNAVFRIACQRLGGCDGEITLTGPNGENFGGAEFAGLPDDPETFADVSVTLTPVAVEALEDQGAIVTVRLGGDRGYRTFMRS